MPPRPIAIRTALFACGVASLLLALCGASCGGRECGPDEHAEGSGDLGCCAPNHNRYFVPRGATLDADACLVTGGGLWKESTGVGFRYPSGTQVRFTYCSVYSDPQSCDCIKGAWNCGL